jgi:hypothetical protein
MEEIVSGLPRHESLDESVETRKIMKTCAKVSFICLGLDEKKNWKQLEYA